MTRSHTCHDNPLFLSDCCNEWSVRKNKEAVIHTPDLEDNQSTEDLDCLPENRQSITEESKKSFLLNEEIADNIHVDCKRQHCNDNSFLGSQNDDVERHRCIQCNTSQYNNRYDNDECHR